MTDQDIALWLMMNEPYFSHGGKDYSVCIPDDHFCTWDSDGNKLDFDTVTDLLDHWLIGGEPFRRIVPKLME